ncbi:ABC transporter ATP-binding protein [Candidatus Saccharibacteria bacterium TM7i]|nr:ABC transporter ATP-binding protein [Candidatus Saccharibacteria bacterium TM7i]
MNARQQAVKRLIESDFQGDVQAAVDEVKKYLLESYGKQEAPLVRPATPTGPILLSVKNLSKTYKRGRQKIPVLHDISLDIHEGEFVAITGASGSGKSTLLQLLGGLDKPTSGEVLYDGINLAKLSDGKLSAFRRQTVGFVFQFFYLQPFLRLGVNLEVPGMFARTKRKARHEASERLAGQVGLDDRLSHFPRELSGGQMQRAAIARALFNQPKILLADEPTGNLDSENGKAIIELFELIRQELGTTVVIVTHDKDIARRADRIIQVKDGALV